MDILQHFRASAAILEESIKLFSKNGRIMSLIALVSAILYSSLFLFLNFSTNSLVNDMLLKQYSFMLYPSIPINGPAGAAAAAADTNNLFEAIMRDAKLLTLVDVSFLVGIYIVSFCTTVTTVIILAASYNDFSGGNGLSASSLQKYASWNDTIKPALITSLYTTLLSAGYFVIFSILVSPLLMCFITTGYTLFSSFAIVSVITATIIYIYLNVEWILALVVSLMEENNYGIQGLGRAGLLLNNNNNVEGNKKVQGFILNVFFYMVSWILSLGFVIIFGKKAIMANQTALWVFGSVVMSLMKMMQLVSYTVLYLDCKKECGEEIMELQSSNNGYRKVSNV